MKIKYKLALFFMKVWFKLLSNRKQKAIKWFIKNKWEVKGIKDKVDWIEIRAILYMISK